MATGTVNKRAWVKNAAIIFLAVMLVLTFFSNTIMNYALPEVAAQYAQSGTITSKVRATAEVKANMTFSVVADQTRVVDSVAVRSGDMIDAGGVLYYLKDEESQELKEAQKTLADMELAYEKALLSLPVPDYSADERLIGDMREDLATLIADRNSIEDKDAKVKAAKAAVEAAQDNVDALTDKQADINDQIAALADGSSALKDYKAALTNATKALESAKKALEKANAELAAFGGSSADIESAQADVDAKQRALENAQLTLLRSQEDASRNYMANQQAVYDAEAARDTIRDTIPVDMEALQAAENAIKAAEKTRDDTEITNRRTIEDNQNIVNSAMDDLSKAQSKLAELQSQSSQRQMLQNTVDSCQANVDRCQAAVDTAQANYDNALEQTSSSLKSQLDTIKSQLKTANRTLTNAQEALTKAQAEAGMTTEDADKAILAKQREIEAAQQTLSTKKETDLNEAKKNNLDIEAQEHAIETQKALVEKYQKQGSGATITSQYAGVVSSVSAVAGDTVSTGATVAVIEVVEKGYSLEFAVTNDQAKLIKVGDAASINSWWYSDVTVTVAALKNDPQNPGKGRIVVCDVKSGTDGGVTVGQSLSIVLGERGATYDIVVPNSAIREDSNGKFVLVVESKSSPLGNRYVATRADITVVASDDNSSAITGALYGNEFVITTSTKPIEAGQQVRLVEN
ncbi:MAG: HlyD family efflux transporter periplasmic adaptor subunit [Clostridiaceae bacterium]|nr:HlyD family efflux transporter periplasmic adaptor subunit [Clostridiaceae bacterium]